MPGARARDQAGLGLLAFLPLPCSPPPRTDPVLLAHRTEGLDTLVLKGPTPAIATSWLLQAFVPATMAQLAQQLAAEGAEQGGIEATVPGLGLSPPQAGGPYGYEDSSPRNGRAASLLPDLAQSSLSGVNSARRATLPSLKRIGPRAGGTESYQDSMPLYVNAHRDSLPSFNPEEFETRQGEMQRATPGITDSLREVAQREARHKVETGEVENVYPPLPAPAAANAPIAVSGHQVGVPEPGAPAPAVPPAEGPAGGPKTPSFVTTFPPHAQDPRTAPHTLSLPTSRASIPTSLSPNPPQIPQHAVGPKAAGDNGEMVIVPVQSLWSPSGLVHENSRPASLLRENSRPASAQSKASRATVAAPSATVGLMLWPGPKDELMVTDKKAGTSAAASALLPGDGQPSAPGAPVGCF